MKCITCGKETINQKFCSRSCAAKHNNHIIPKRSRTPKRTCQNCGLTLKRASSVFCSFDCQIQYQFTKYIERWKNGLEDGVKGDYGVSRHIIRYLREKYGNKCARCGWNEVNPYTGNTPLEVEHIDGNYQNNCEDNLILQCPNCHSLTATYKGANRGKGRTSRSKYYEKKS